MNLTRRTHPSPRTQRGVTILVTLVLLVVMLLGGVALSRLTEVGTLAAGNAAYHEASVQASEVGINNAFAAVRDLVDEEVNVGPWYFASSQGSDANGMPVVNWAGMPEVVVGSYSVRYVVDRLCTGVLPVTDFRQQCLNKSITTVDGRRVGVERPDPPAAKQFRISVRVVGPKDTQTFVQSMVTRG
jgi:type IV pilus assembly protein PilX